MTTLIRSGPPLRRGQSSGRNRNRSASHRWLLLQLRRLLAKAKANPTNAGGSLPPPEIPEPATSEWEDDNFAYFEYELPGRVGPDIDVSVHDGMAMIRVEKK